ncbi:MAG: hypothetical protein AB7P04_12490 [Bacteriovoracia bacterium]
MWYGSPMEIHGKSAWEVRRHSKAAPWTYARKDERQRELMRAGEGRFLLSEVSPVITLGRRAGADQLLASPDDFASRGVEVLTTDRGGLATYHGPGQWVLFPVFPLARLVGDSRGVRKAVEGLLEIGVRAARQFDCPAEIRGGTQTGVWTARGKLASVGVQIVDGWLLHGLAINFFRTPESFFGINPCGLCASADFVFSEPPASALFDEAGQVITRATEAVYGSAENSIF